MGKGIDKCGWGDMVKGMNDEIFFNERIFGKVLVKYLKFSLERRGGMASQFQWVWGNCNNEALYNTQDMRMADLLCQMNNWHNAQQILWSNENYSKCSGTPVLVSAVVAQNRIIEESIKKANECLVKEYPEIKHFNNKGQGQWVNGLPQVVYEPRGF